MFMEHEITQEHFYRINTDNCEEYLVPKSICSPKQIPDNPKEFVEYTESGSVVDVESVFGFFCRLSAPGYMDCTDWIGPFETEEEAENYLVDNYDE